MPCKDTIEELLLGPNRRMDAKTNFLVTLGIVSTCFVLAVAIPDIATAMTFIGATSNPLVGFTLPIVFYLRMDTLRGGNTSCLAPHRLLAHGVNVICICSGIITLVLMFK